MYKSKELIRQAMQLYTLGQRIHRKQIALGALVDKEGFTTQKVQRASQELEAQLAEFSRLEQAHLKYRDEYIRAKGGTPCESNRNSATTGQFGQSSHSERTTGNIRS